MSYCELRNFSEMLRSLGYPRQISIENFRTPNFKLVAEILAWLLTKYEPDYDIPTETDTEQDRIIFIKTAAQFLIQKARIKVNPKKLYQADGYAVQEMLKVASVLYEAIQQNQNIQAEEDDTFNVKAVANAVNAKLNELRLSRKLATEITESGATLYDLLNKEVDLREQRSLALARPLEIQEVEKSIQQSVKATEEGIKQTVHNLDNIASDEANLDAKIEKKKADFERQQKRLAQLQSVRPAYLDEYEKLQAELHGIYAQYVQKFRNLAYLENIYNNYDRIEQERNLEAELSLKRMAEAIREEERLKQEEADRLEAANAAAMQNNNINAGDEFAEDGQTRLQPQVPKFYGSMTGAGISDDEEENEQNGSALSDDDEDDVVIGGIERPGEAIARMRPSMAIRSATAAASDLHEQQHQQRLQQQQSQGNEVLSDLSDEDDLVETMRHGPQTGQGGGAPPRGKSALNRSIPAERGGGDDLNDSSDDNF